MLEDKTTDDAEKILIDIENLDLSDIPLTVLVSDWIVDYEFQLHLGIPIAEANHGYNPEREFLKVIYKKILKKAYEEIERREEKYEH